MSHLGTRILYNLINQQDDLACERAFSPWIDLEAELRARGLPLVSLETFTPLRDFDVVGFSLQYELCYTNVLQNLDLGGIPLRSKDRGEHICNALRLIAREARIVIAHSRALHLPIITRCDLLYSVHGFSSARFVAQQLAESYGKLLVCFLSVTRVLPVQPPQAAINLVLWM